MHQRFASTVVLALQAFLLLQQGPNQGLLCDTIGYSNFCRVDRALTPNSSQGPRSPSQLHALCHIAALCLVDGNPIGEAGPS